jgi:hypothetical protein
MPEYRVDPEGAARIAGAFDETFARWEIALPRGAVERGEPWTIQREGWTIRCIFGADEDGSYLEYYATHRMTSDSRYRIYASGRTEERDAIWEMFMWDPKKPGDQARERKEYADHNARIADELKLLGLYPEGDINAYLRTEGPPENEGDGPDAGGKA